MKPAYEHFDHTADLGIRVRAETLADLVAPAADGLYAAIGKFVSAGTPESIALNIAGDDPAVILRDFLAELLDLFERGRRFASAVEVSAFTDTGLTATAHTELVDFERSALHREVKAITYHELAIRAIDGGYEATVIVDI